MPSLQLQALSLFFPKEQDNSPDFHDLLDFSVISSLLYSRKTPWYKYQCSPFPDLNLIDFRFCEAGHVHIQKKKMPPELRLKIYHLGDVLQIQFSGAPPFLQARRPDPDLWEEARELYKKLNATYDMENLAANVKPLPGSRT